MNTHPKPQPNILFFLTDDQRFDTIRALGNQAISTPNLDALVARGTTCTQAYIMGGSSPAVCMPSRAMIHTGRTLYHLQEQGQEIPMEHALLGETLRAVGYHAFGTGKWHNGKQAFNRSFDTGSDIFFGGMEDHWNVPAFDYDPQGRYDARYPFCPQPGNSNEVKYRLCDHISMGKHSSELFADAAVSYLKQAEPDKPFFMYVSFMAPHDPRTMPEEYLRMYDSEAMELPPNFLGGHPFDNGELHIRDEQLEAWPRTPQAIRRHLAEYYAMITHADAQIGRVIATLEQRGLAENTIVVFAGDNGLALGQHGLMGKQSNYQHSVHIPLIFAGPGIPAGVQNDGFCYLLDIFPTLCDAAGIPTPDSVEGTSLMPLLQDPRHHVRDVLHFAYRELHRAVRDERYKLIEYAVKGHRVTQLFDLVADPWEQTNLADDPEHKDTLARLRQQLGLWRELYDDDKSPQGQTFWQTFDQENCQ